MSIEQEIQARGLTAPRITPDDIEANIMGEVYFTAFDGSTRGADVRVTPDFDKEVFDTSLSLLTICVLVLRNGFTVTGESACVSPGNFDVTAGRAIARQNAIDKVWPLMGYALKEKLAKEKGDWFDRLLEERDELAERIEKLETFLDLTVISDPQRKRLNAQHAVMSQYHDMLDDRIGDAALERSSNV